MSKKTLTLNWVIESYRDYFQEFKLTEENVIRYFESWKEGRKAASVNDYLWHIFQQIVKTIAQQSKSEEQFYRLNAEVYKKMWEFLVTVENRNGSHILRQKFINELNLLKLTSKYKLQIEVISGHCCSFCDSLNGKKMTIQEAIEQQPLASKLCTRKWGGCNCCYSETYVRDENGCLIPVD